MCLTLEQLGIATAQARARWDAADKRAQEYKGHDEVERARRNVAGKDCLKAYVDLKIELEEKVRQTDLDTRLAAISDEIICEHCKKDEPECTCIQCIICGEIGNPDDMHGRECEKCYEPCQSEERYDQRRDDELLA